MSEDTVRIIRILEYIGPRSWVEMCIEKRGVKGSHRIDDTSIIREALLGDVAEIIEKAQTDAQ